MNQLRTDVVNYASAQRGLRHIFIRDLQLSARIGIHAHEKATPQNIVINVDVAVQETDQTITHIAHTVCYEQLTLRIQDRLAQGHIDLVETLAEQIAEDILEDPRILMARVRIEKPDAIAAAAGVGVEIERRQLVSQAPQ